MKPPIPSDEPITLTMRDLLTLEAVCDFFLGTTTDRTEDGIQYTRVAVRTTLRRVTKVKEQM